MRSEALITALDKQTLHGPVADQLLQAGQGSLPVQQPGVWHYASSFVPVFSLLLDDV